MTYPAPTPVPRSIRPRRTVPPAQMKAIQAEYDPNRLALAKHQGSEYPPCECGADRCPDRRKGVPHGAA